MTARVVVCTSPILQTEPTVTTAPSRLISFLPHAPFIAFVPALDIMVSVEASMHIRTSCDGMLVPGELVATTHSPGLRCGRSTARADDAVVTPVRISTARTVGNLIHNLLKCRWDQC